MSDQTPRDDAAMADILASIRKIVTEEQAGPARGGAVGLAAADGVLELTPAMRVDGGVGAKAAEKAASRPAPAPVAARAPEPGYRSGASGAGAPAVEAPARDAVSRSAEAAPPAPPTRASAPSAAAAPSRQVGADDDEGLAPPDGLSLDEAAVADIVRAVMRDEFAGAFGRSLTQQIRQLISAEVSRAMAAERRARQ